MKTFLLADNQDITREGIKALIGSAGIAAQVIRVRNRAELQEWLRAHPDAVVVLDYALFDFVSAQQMLVACESARHSRWILFSDEPAAAFLRLVLVANPTLSVVFKYDTAEEITDALLHAARGERFICDSAARLLDERAAPAPTTPLTAMERAVLREIAMGKTTKEIAWEKKLSFHTVNAHRKNIFRKIEVNNVHEAIRYALRAGIIDQAEYFI